MVHHHIDDTVRFTFAELELREQLSTVISDLFDASLTLFDIYSQLGPKSRQVFNYLLLSGIDVARTAERSGLPIESVLDHCLPIYAHIKRYARDIQAELSMNTTHYEGALFYSLVSTAEKFSHGHPERN